MNNTIRMSVYTALFTALIAVGSHISLSIGPIAIVLANMFIFLGSLILGIRWAPVAVGLFLLLGIFGVPVFQGGGAGITHIIGPSGGYLIGYLAASVIIALISGTWETVRTEDGKIHWITIIRISAAVAAGICVIYVFGVPWLKLSLELSWAQAFTAGFTPFILPDLGKGAAAVYLAILIKPQTVR